jgi:hypothetical protein
MIPAVRPTPPEVAIRIAPTVALKNDASVLFVEADLAESPNNLPSGVEAVLDAGDDTDDGFHVLVAAGIGPELSQASEKFSMIRLWLQRRR